MNIKTTLSGISLGMDDLGQKVSKLDSSQGEILQKFDDLEGRVVQVTGALSVKIDNISSRLIHCETELKRAEITIAGIPSDIDDTPKNVITKVFTALDIPDLITDTLEIRDLSPKGKMSHGSTNQSNTDNSSSRPNYKTILVSLKSTMVRDYILRKKRAKRQLKVSDVFDSPHNGQIYINECLSPYLYNLSKRTKAKVREMGWRSCYVESGNIFARKVYGAPPLPITCDEDLAQIS